MSRISRNKYYIELIKTVALRSSCDRAAVGAIAVKDNRIIATGYNGSPVKMKSCDDIGHYIVAGHCLRTVHSEANIVCQAAKFGTSLKDAELYCTHEPCFECQKLLINAGIKRVYYINAKQDDRVYKEFMQKIKLIQVK